MKKFLIAGSSLAAVAAAGSAGAVDVTLGGSIDMGIKYGVGKDTGDANFALTDNYQSISISVAAAGTTDAGLKFGGSFGISTATELVFNPYDKDTDDDEKSVWKLVNSSADVNLRGIGYNVSGGEKVTPGQMVAVKINSDWHEAGSTVSEYGEDFDMIATTSAVCKLAGFITNEPSPANVTRGKYTTYGDSDATADDNTFNNIVALSAGAYAKPGKMTDGNVSFSALTAEGENVSGYAYEANVDGGSDVDADAVHVGPYMEVMMTSSTTKMVVGGVCVTHAAKESKTKIHMDVASRVMHVSDASIYIEGGFGKLSLSTSAYGGSVAGVGSAGDEVKIDGALNATLSSVSFMGMNGHGAVALDTVSLAGRPNYSFGTSIDLLGLTMAVEMEDEQDTVGYIDVWDAATSYDFNGMAVGIATDSEGDWAMSLGYELMGFAMSSVVENVAPGNSEKSGLSIDTSFSTNLNGIGISVALDESLAMTLGASYSMGNSGLTMYVNYSQASGGGKIGATMSF